MTNDEMTQTEKRAYTIELIQNLPAALKHRLVELDELQHQIAELDGTTCTGSEHWRGKATRTTARKLYILHGIDRTCPIHGAPATGKRLRCYVGTKQGNIDRARAAIKRHRQQRELLNQLAKHGEVLKRTLYTIKNIYWRLDYVVPQTDRGLKPYPIETEPSDVGEAL